jgi:uncharacterized glyoxalase superfamily protein PhnB
MRVVTQLSIAGTIEAADMYMKAFGLTMGFAVKHDDGTYAHLSLMSGDVEILSMTENKHISNEKQTRQSNDKTSGIANIGLYGLTKDEVNIAYEVLKTDAMDVYDEPQSCPWLDLYFILTDKYGVGWQVGT